MKLKHNSMKPDQARRGDVADHGVFQGRCLWAVRPRANLPRSSYGLTLTELLSAIGITAILAAILLTTINRMVSNAESVKCLSNLRQVGAGLTLLVNDNYGEMPGAYYPDPQKQAPSDMRQWWIRVGHYMGDHRTTKSMEVHFKCPSNDGPSSIDYCYNSAFEYKNKGTLSPDRVIITENYGQAGGIAFNSTFWRGAIGFWHPTPKRGSAALDPSANPSARASALHLGGHVELLDSVTLLERSKP